MSVERGLYKFGVVSTTCFLNLFSRLFTLSSRHLPLTIRPPRT